MLAKVPTDSGGVALTFENVKTNAAESVDIWVIDLGKEADFGWGHGVVVGKEQLELEDAACCCQPRSAARLSAPTRPITHPHMATAKGHRW